MGNNLHDNEYQSKMNALKSSNEFKLSQSTNEIKSILQKHNMEIKEIESTQESTIKGLQIKHNLDNNQILKVQKGEIEKLKQKHEEYLVDVQQSMECDIASLNAKQQSLEQQKVSLQSFKEQNEEMKLEYDAKLEQMRIEQEERLINAKSKWDKSFNACKLAKEIETKEFVNKMKQAKIDCVSENEMNEFKAKYAMDIEQKKQGLKKTMHCD